MVQAPDGTLWKMATSAKKDTRPAERRFDEIVLLIGAEDISASKKFYVGHGLTVGKSFGSYVDFTMGSSPIGFGLYKRRAGQGRRRAAGGHGIAPAHGRRRSR